MKFWDKYQPLFAMVILAALAALCINMGVGGTLRQWMHYFMGTLFVQFSLFKLFNLEMFAEGFAKYDLLAKRSTEYAFAYPFIELGLGLAYLALILPILVYILTIILLVFGAVGVIKALMEGLDVRCACMGTVLNVPLSTVTLTEDLGMALMALLMLIF